MNAAERQALREKHSLSHWQECGLCSGYWGEECGHYGSLCDDNAYSVDKYGTNCYACDPKEMSNILWPCDVIKVLNELERVLAI